MVNEQEFQAERELLRHFSSLSRVKATQILTIVGLFFIYFQLIYNADIKNVTQLYNALPNGLLNATLSKPLEGYLYLFDQLSLPTPVTTVSPFSIAFGILTFVFIWQLYGLVWYVHIELTHIGEDWRYNKEYNKRKWVISDTPFAKVYNSVSVEANKGVFKLFRKFSGFRIYTDFHGEKSFVNFIVMMGVIFLNLLIIFYPSILLINCIL